MMEKLMNEKESGAIEKEVNNSSIQVWCQMISMHSKDDYMFSYKANNIKWV
jgi:hypothetical protein